MEEDVAVTGGVGAGSEKDPQRLERCRQVTVVLGDRLA